MSNMKSLFLNNRTNFNSVIFFIAIAIGCNSMYAQKIDVDEMQKMKQVQGEIFDINGYFDELKIDQDEREASINNMTFQFIKINFEKFSLYENERFNILLAKGNDEDLRNLDSKINTYAESIGYPIERITDNISYQEFSSNQMYSLKHLKENEEVLKELNKQKLKNIESRQ